MRKFDGALRRTKEWMGWQDNRAHLYAVRQGGKLYPVKKLASMASGVPVGKFSGGRYAGHTNSLLEAVGFHVIPLRGGNPDWVRDELILALDLYLRYRPNPPGKTSKEIVALSRTLQRLGQRLFPPSQRADSYRNANGVYMKLMNFRRLDPDYTTGGRKGLTRGAKGEEEVWAEFAGDPRKCEVTAKAIVAAIDDPEAEGPETATEGIEEAMEGRLLTRKHLSRERNRKLVEAKRKQAVRTLGKLKCEVCGFDFAAAYGARGEGFIECHHKKPLATLTDGDKTHIDDLALVCANCHRMIHRTKEWLTVEQLRYMLAKASA